MADHPVCSSSVTSDDDDDLTVDVTSIEDVTVAAGEEDDEDATGGCLTPCPVKEFMAEDCQEEQAPCPLQDEPDQDNNTGIGPHQSDSDQQRCPLDDVPCPADGVFDLEDDSHEDEDAPCSADHEYVPCPASSDVGVECQGGESCPAEDEKTIAEDEEDECGGWVKVEESTLPKEHARTETVQQQEAAKEEK